jgi:hypothetical protein
MRIISGDAGLLACNICFCEFRTMIIPPRLQKYTHQSRRNVVQSFFGTDVVKYQPSSGVGGDNPVDVSLPDKLFKRCDASMAAGERSTYTVDPSAIVVWPSLGDNETASKLELELNEV